MLADPSPKTTLAIVLGASEWPESPDFTGSEAFANAAYDFKQYLRDPHLFGLPQENLLDLFDTELGPDRIDKAIRRFLDKRTSEMSADGNAARDVLIYFVGHGGFVGRNSEYYLAVRCTSSENPDVSGIRMEPLINTITDKARFLRRIFILDCCYAGTAYKAFQAEGPAQVAIRQTNSALKEKAKTIGAGASLLCSSGKDAPSLLTQDSRYTTFSKALLQALMRGNPRQHNQLCLSLREVADLTEEVLHNLGENSPRPEVHSPDQVEGDVARVQFFPNPARKTAEALQSRGRSAQDDIVAFLRHVAGQLRQARSPEELVGRLDRLAEEVYQPCSVAVVGQVKSGKSTLINALLRADLANVDVATDHTPINYFRYTNDATRVNVRCFWRDGKAADVDLDFVNSLQGTDIETLLRLNNIDHLEYFLNNPYLEHVTLIDTPGMGAVVDEHQNVSAEFIHLRRQLRERHDRETRELGDMPDAVIYLIEANARFTDQELVEVPRAQVFNAVGVMSKIDKYPEIIERRTELSAKIAGLLQENLNTVLPVSAGLRRALDVLLANNQAGLKRLVEAVRTIKPGKFDLLFSSPELYLERDSDWPVSTKQREELWGNMPWRVFVTIARVAADSSLDLDEVSKRLNAMTGFDQLQEVLEQRIFNRSVTLRCYRILCDAREILHTIRNEHFPNKTEETLAGELERELETRFFQLDQYDLVLDNSDFKALRLVLDNSTLFSPAEQGELRSLLGLYGTGIEERLPSNQKSREYILARQRYWMHKSTTAVNALLSDVARQAAFRYSLILSEI